LQSIFPVSWQEKIKQKQFSDFLLTGILIVAITVKYKTSFEIDNINLDLFIQYA